MGINKAQHFRKITKAANQPLRARNPAPQKRKDIQRKIATIFQRFVSLTTKQRDAFLLDVVRNKLPQLIDNRNRVLITFLLSISPREKTVTTQHDTVAVWTFPHRPAQHHG